MIWYGQRTPPVLPKTKNPCTLQKKPRVTKKKTQYFPPKNPISSQAPPPPSTLINPPPPDTKAYPEKTSPSLTKKPPTLPKHPAAKNTLIPYPIQKPHLNPPTSPKKNPSALPKQNPILTRNPIYFQNNAQTPKTFGRPCHTHTNNHSTPTLLDNKNDAPKHVKDYAAVLLTMQINNYNAHT